MLFLNLLSCHHTLNNGMIKDGISLVFQYKGALNIVSLLKKIFGDGNQRQIKRLEKTVDQIEALESTYEAYSNEALQDMTNQLKDRYEKGETLRSEERRVGK